MCNSVHKTIGEDFQRKPEYTDFRHDWYSDIQALRKSYTMMTNGVGGEREICIKKKVAGDTRDQKSSVVYMFKILKITNIKCFTSQLSASEEGPITNSKYEV